MKHGTIEWWNRYRLWVGGVLLFLSVIPWLLLLFIPFMDVSTGKGAGLAVGLIVIAEIIFFIALVILGKEAYDRIRAKLRLRRKSGTDVTS